MMNRWQRDPESESGMDTKMKITREHRRLMIEEFFDRQDRIEVYNLIKLGSNGTLLENKHKIDKLNREILYRSFFK
jgi:hypothetical protein